LLAHLKLIMNVYSMTLKSRRHATRRPAVFHSATDGSTGGTDKHITRLQVLLLYAMRDDLLTKGTRMRESIESTGSC
jgi:hypothetical protein